MDVLKDLPIRAIPFVIFPGAAFLFGQLFINIPTNDPLQQLVSAAMAVFTFAASVLFFTKVFANWPPMHGLDMR